MDRPADTAFDELFRAEYPAVVRVVASITGSVEDAEAVTQDAFLKAYVRWHRVGAYDRPGAWVRRVAIRDAVRLASRARRRPPADPPPGGDLALAAAGRVDMARALTRLPANPRTAVVLHDLAGWPVAEVAATLGCAEATVRVHLHRGRRALAGLSDLDREDHSDVTT